MVAPNVQVKPSDPIFTNTLAPLSPLAQPLSPPAPPPASRPINITSLMHDLREIEVIQNGAGELSSSPVNDDKELTIGPRRLKASDIELIEKISIGQFSCVWKGRCRYSTDQLDGQSIVNDQYSVPEYAVKVFGAHQKSAWSNERDIYNLLSTTNEFILKYYGSDVNEKG